jgi:hypothetical protein
VNLFPPRTLAVLLEAPETALTGGGSTFIMTARPGC